MPESLQTRWSMLERLRGPEAEAGWRWFMERYRGYARSCLRRVVHDSGRLAVAEQELWSYLFTSEVFRRADRGQRFRSYLAGTIRNYGRQWLRQDRQAASDEPEAPEPSVSDPLPEAEELRLWARHVLWLALTELERRAARSARAVRLFYGLDDDEDGIAFVAPQPVSAIARTLDLQPNAVHQALHRGRAQLRALIEAELHQTLRESDTLDDEIGALRAVLGQAPGLVG